MGLKVSPLGGISELQSHPQKKVSKIACHQCGKEGHWKRNSQTYLAEKKGNPSSIILPIIDISLALDASHGWVLDTGCPSNI